jgi:type II secretory pathway pseudopilin PulG
MNPRRRAFTLFELMLAIALSATLLALIGTAINLYLVRGDAGRTQVEQAQLARSILAMIADDIRATSVYVPQDVSAVAQLLADSPSREDDSADSSQTEGSGTSSGSGSAGTASNVGFSASSSGGGSSGESSSSSASGEEGDTTLPLGVNGTLAELYIDATRLPQREELFRTITGYTNAPMPMPAAGASTAAAATAAAGIVPPTDLKTVRYFIRQGESIEPGRVYANPLTPEIQQRASGLVRQEIPRRLRMFAEQSGNSAILDAGQLLVAPEVVHLEFRYYDGQQVTDVWDMQDQRSLPLAIEVRIWLASPEAANAVAGSTSDLANLLATAREYRLTVHLPMAAMAAANQRGGSAALSESNFGAP